jgi:hypothetical protein
MNTSGLSTVPPGMVSAPYCLPVAAYTRPLASTANNKAPTPMCKKARRDMPCILAGIICPRSQTAGGLLDGSTHPWIRAATANIAAHGLIYLPIARGRRRLQQARRRHDLTCLAITALGDVMLDPGLLHGLAHPIVCHGLYRGNGVPCSRRDWRNACADGRAVQVHGAGAAQRHAAAKLGAGHSQFIP